MAFQRARVFPWDYPRVAPNTFLNGLGVGLPELNAKVVPTPRLKVLCDGIRLFSGRGRSVAVAAKKGIRLADIYS
jgi:hypothetical protein